MVWACAAKRRWCLGEEMYGVWSRGSQIKRNTKQDLERVVEKDCQARKLNKEDAIDRSRWRKLIQAVWRSGLVSVGECFFWYQPTWAVPDKGPLNGCVCVRSILIKTEAAYIWVPENMGHFHSWKTKPDARHGCQNTGHSRKYGIVGNPMSSTTTVFN